MNGVSMIVNRVLLVIWLGGTSKPLQINKNQFIVMGKRIDEVAPREDTGAESVQTEYWITMAKFFFVEIFGRHADLLVIEWTDTPVKTRIAERGKKKGTSKLWVGRLVGLEPTTS